MTYDTGKQTNQQILTGYLLSVINAKIWQETTTKSLLPRTLKIVKMRYSQIIYMMKKLGDIWTMYNSCYNIPRRERWPPLSVVIRGNLWGEAVRAEVEVCWDGGRPKGVLGRKGGRICADVSTETCKVWFLLNDIH